MSLDFLSKAQIRRHLRVPFAATPAGNVTMGIRAVTRAAQLELYMNVLAPEEEAILLGRPYALIQFLPPFTLGQVLQISIASYATPSISGTVTYTVQSSDISAQYPWQSIAQNMATELNALNNTLGLEIESATGIPTDPMSPPVSAPPFAQITMWGPSLFSVTVTGGGLFLLANGTVYPNPIYTTSTQSGQSISYYGLLPICNALESDLINLSPQLAYSNAGASSTGLVTFRPDSLRQRHQLYRYYVRQMGISLGFYPATLPSGGGGRTFGIVIG